jgi:hypothetical protein
MFSTYWKATIAAIVTAVGTVSAIVQAAMSDDTITSDEWGLILSAAITGVVTTLAVYNKRNTPA